MNILDVLGFFPLQHGSDFGGVHLDSFSGYDKPKVFDLRLMVFAFFGLQVQSGLQESFEYGMNMLSMFFQGLAVDQDIVKVGGGVQVEAVT